MLGSFGLKTITGVAAVRQTPRRAAAGDPAFARTALPVWALHGRPERERPADLLPDLAEPHARAVKPGTDIVSHRRAHRRPGLDRQPFRIVRPRMVLRSGSPVCR